MKRLEDSFGKGVLDIITLHGIPKDIESAIALANKADDRTRKEFEKWAVLKEGESMTIAKAENSFNLYLANNLKTSYKPPEKSKTYNVFDELYEDLQKQKHQNNE